VEGRRDTSARTASIAPSARYGQGESVWENGSGWVPASSSRPWLSNSNESIAQIQRTGSRRAGGRSAALTGSILFRLFFIQFIEFILV